MTRWAEFTISNQGHKGFVNLDAIVVVRQAPASEPGVTLIEWAGGRLNVYEKPADVMARIWEARSG